MMKNVDGTEDKKGMRKEEWKSMRRKGEREVYGGSDKCKI